MTVGDRPLAPGPSPGCGHAITEGAAPSRLRIAWVEEWMSSLAAHVLPYLASRHDVHYITAGEQFPKADFVQVIRGKRGRYMNVAGFELSRYVNRLYRAGLIDVAAVWASIGFALGRVPFINLEGGSVYAQIRLAASRRPFHRRIRNLPGLVHYALPELVCNRRAARVIVPSNALKRDLMRLHHLPERKMVVVPHGVEDRHMALYRRRTPGRLRGILYAGRLHPMKGIAAVLEEFIRRRDIGVEFVIAGDGPDRARMEATAAGDDRVKILGAIGQEQLESLLVAADIFVFPTFYEGFGLALLEAMASGHACVCYDLPVTREILGDTGVTVPVGDAAALVESVARLVADPEAIATCSERAHQRASRFSWERAQTSIDRIIRDTVLELQPR